MKKLIAANIALVLFAGAAMAQTRLTADVPFSFYVVDTQMPAGSYTVHATMSIPQIIQVSSATSNHRAISLFSPIATSSTVMPSKLVFNRYGADYFLAEVWVPGASTGRLLPRGRAEVELAKVHQPVRLESVIAAR